MQGIDGPLYCADCAYWDVNSPESGYCSHPSTIDFNTYAENCYKAGVVIDAADCGGFKPASERLSVEGDRNGD